DLPGLSTVGVILADSSLYLPDYTATERTYQLLTQVLGRVGRGHTDARIVIQTYHPKNELFRSALDDNWQNFYNKELEERRSFHFPPFYHLLKLSVRRTTRQSADKAAEKFKTTLLEQHLDISVDGPAPAFREKISNEYRWQLVVKSRQRSQLLRALDLL